MRDEKPDQDSIRDPKQVYRLAPKLRAERLDIFAAGYQDLIGQREIALFGGRRGSEGFEGKFEVKELVKNADDKTAAKVTGWSLKREGMTPTVVVLIDSEGVICGVARSWKTDALMSRVFYGGAFSRIGFLGYIRNYDPKQRYLARCVDDEMLSDEYSCRARSVRRPCYPRGSSSYSGFRATKRNRDMCSARPSLGTTLRISLISRKPISSKNVVSTCVLKAQKLVLSLFCMCMK